MPRILTAVPAGVWDYVLPGIGFLLVLMGTRRNWTRVSEADRVVEQHKYWLLLIPTGVRAEPFSRVRYIHFLHSRDVVEDQPDMVVPDDRYHEPDPSAHLLGFHPYEIHIVLQDRTRLTMCRGYGHERMLDIAERLVRMTGTRLA